MRGLKQRPLKAAKRKGRWRYGLLVESLTLEGRTLKSYGVAVSDAASGYRARCRNVTASAKEALALLRLLAQSAVTPVSLPEIVEDWLAR